MNPLIPFILSDYVSNVAGRIKDKYGFEEQVALRKFLESETYRMLADPKLEMWEFVAEVIFEMWECEQVTGDPRNSPYLREE